MKMKQLILLCLTIIVTFGAIAQDRTIQSVRTKFATGLTYFEYTGVAADTLGVVDQDTIDIVIINQNHGAIEKIAITLELDQVAGNDSIYYTLTGYNQSGGTGTSIATGGMLVDQATGKLIDVSKSYNASTSPDLSFRFYTLRLIQDDNASYDGGAKIKKILGKIYLK